MPGVEMGGAEGTAVDRWLLGTEEETESYTAFRGAGSLQRWFPRCPKVLVNCRFCLHQTWRRASDLAPLCFHILRTSAAQKLQIPPPCQTVRPCRKVPAASS